MYWVVRAFFAFLRRLPSDFVVGLLVGALRVRIGLGIFFSGLVFFRGFVPWFALVGFRPCMLWRLSPLSVSSPPSHASSCTCAFGGRRVEGQGVGHARPDVPSALRVREVLSIANSC